MEGASALDIVTLVVAIVGLGLALVSLAWQVVSWRLEGPSVKVSTAFAFLTEGAQVSDLHLLVKARNVGRSAVGITGWGVDLGGGRSAVVLRPLQSSTVLPTTLEAGHDATFFMGLELLRQRLREDPTTTPRGYVDLATGERRHSKLIRLPNG